MMQEILGWMSKRKERQADAETAGMNSNYH